MTGRRKWALVASVGLVVGVASTPILFGSRTRTDEYWGETTIRRRWGVEREMLIDRDLDGTADVRITYPGANRMIATHDRPHSVHIDNDLDGTFEIEWNVGHLHCSVSLQKTEQPSTQVPTRRFQTGDCTFGRGMSSGSNSRRLNSAVQPSPTASSSS